MPQDHDMIIVTGRCSRCSRPVSASFADLRAAGIFNCVCGHKTQARHTPPVEATIFRGGGWSNPNDAYPRSTWR